VPVLAFHPRRVPPRYRHSYPVEQDRQQRDPGPAGGEERHDAFLPSPVSTAPGGLPSGPSRMLDIAAARRTGLVWRDNCPIS